MVPEDIAQVMYIAGELLGGAASFIDNGFNDIAELAGLGRQTCLDGREAAARVEKQFRQGVVGIFQPFHNLGTIGAEHLVGAVHGLGCFFRGQFDRFDKTLVGAVEIDDCIVTALGDRLDQIG